MDTLYKRNDSYLSYKILVSNVEFYQTLPNYNISERNKNQMFKANKRLGERNATVKSIFSKAESRFSTYKERQVLIDERIYSPFMLTYSMILQFQDHPEKELLSIRDIMRIFIESNKPYRKYYFKVFQLSHEQHVDNTKLSEF